MAGKLFTKPWLGSLHSSAGIPVKEPVRSAELCLHVTSRISACVYFAHSIHMNTYGKQGIVDAGPICLDKHILIHGLVSPLAIHIVGYVMCNGIRQMVPSENVKLRIKSTN